MDTLRHFHLRLRERMASSCYFPLSRLNRPLSRGPWSVSKRYGRSNEVSRLNISPTSTTPLLPPHPRKRTMSLCFILANPWPLRLCNNGQKQSSYPQQHFPPHHTPRNVKTQHFARLSPEDPCSPTLPAPEPCAMDLGYQTARQ